MVLDSEMRDFLTANGWVEWYGGYWFSSPTEITDRGGYPLQVAYEIAKKSITDDSWRQFD